MFGVRSCGGSSGYRPRTFDRPENLVALPTQKLENFVTKKNDGAGSQAIDECDGIDCRDHERTSFAGRSQDASVIVLLLGKQEVSQFHIVP